MSGYADIMIDVETTSTRPDHGAILQIAAVKFDPYAKEIDTNFFYANLAMAEGRYWEEGTRHWWSQQDPAVFEAVTTNPQNPADVMMAFANWSGYDNPEPLRFWAKPTSFDFSFIDSYFVKFGIANPYSFRRAIDLNSFMQGRANRMGHFDLDIPFEGDAHNGIYDCLHQIKMAFAVCTEGFTAP